MISARTKAALAAAKRRGVQLGGDRGSRSTNKQRQTAIAVRQGRADVRAADLAPVVKELQAAGAVTLGAIAAALEGARHSCCTRWLMVGQSGEPAAEGHRQPFRLRHRKCSHRVNGGGETRVEAAPQAAHLQPRTGSGAPKAVPSHPPTRPSQIVLICKPGLHPPKQVQQKRREPRPCEISAGPLGTQRLPETLYAHPVAVSDFQIRKPWIVVP
jgi:hypothetical protein